jgi:hypothetical protein
MSRRLIAVIVQAATAGTDFRSTNRSQAMKMD